MVGCEEVADVAPFAPEALGDVDVNTEDVPLRSGSVLVF
jgi:hypothetical protein